VDLPRGLFWVKSAGGMPESMVNSLVKSCQDLYRNVLIVTDHRVDHEPTEVVSINDDPDGAFDYCFLSDAESEMDPLHERIVPMVKDVGWRCWMVPRHAESPSWDDAVHEARRILLGHRFDAVCQQDVTVNLGPNRDVILSRAGVVSSVMCPNSGDAFWREVFRACGFYGVRAKVVVGEV